MTKNSSKKLDRYSSKMTIQISAMAQMYVLLILVSISAAKRTGLDKTDYIDFYYKVNVKDCRAGHEQDPSKPAKIILSYTTLKNDNRVIMIGNYAKLLTSIYTDSRVINNGDVIQTYFGEDLNKSLVNRQFNSYHKYGSMGWSDIMIFERMDLNYTWLMPNGTLNFDNLNGGYKIVSSSDNKYCLQIENVNLFNYEGKSLQFTIFYIAIIFLQIAGIVAAIGFTQFIGDSFIKTIPRLSLINSWIIDCDIMIVSLIYLPCFIYAVIGQMFIVLFSVIATNPNFLMEGEFEHMRVAKKVAYGLFGFLVAAVHFYALISEPNNLPFYSLAMYFFAIFDQFFSYSKDFKWVYLCGLYLPKTILVYYIFYFPNTLHMGPANPWELLPLGIGFIAIGSIILFQTLCHPRFFITTQYERELMKLIPKSMLLEDLLKDRNMTEDDVCGICLEPFSSKSACVGIDGNKLAQVQDSNSSIDATLTAPDTVISDSVVQTLEVSAASIQTEKQSQKLTIKQTIIDKTHCNHIFHRECLSAWIDQNENCPICRHTVLNKIR